MGGDSEKAPVVTVQVVRRSSARLTQLVEDSLVPLRREFAFTFGSD